MNEALEIIQAWLGLIAFLISIGSALYAFFTARSKENTQRLDGIDTRLGTHATRLQTVENEIKHLPNKDEVTNLQLSLTRMEGAVAVLTERVEGIGGTVARIDKYLRKVGDE